MTEHVSVQQKSMTERHGRVGFRLDLLAGILGKEEEKRVISSRDAGV